MSQTDPRVDAHIANSADFAKPILTHLRHLIHSACPTVDETLKWRFPFFLHNGLLCHMAAFKHHCHFGFWHSQMRKKLRASTGKTPLTRLEKITTLADLPTDVALTRLIKEAMKINESGSKPHTRPRAKRLKIPTYLTTPLKQNKLAHAKFQSMSPSHQNEYIQWITEAKRPETRTKRITQTLHWLTEGISRNGKYEKTK